jgi:hypothetical protein
MLLRKLTYTKRYLNSKNTKNKRRRKNNVNIKVPYCTTPYTDFYSVEKAEINSRIAKVANQLQEIHPSSAQWVLDGREMRTSKKLIKIGGNTHASQNDPATFKHMQKKCNSIDFPVILHKGNVVDHLANTTDNVSVLYLDFCGNLKDEQVLYNALSAYESIRTNQCVIAFTFSTRLCVLGLTFKKLIARIEKKMRTIIIGDIQCECKNGYNRENGTSGNRKGQTMVFCSYYVNWEETVITRYTIREKKWLDKHGLFRISWMGYPLAEDDSFLTADFEELPF